MICVVNNIMKVHMINIKWSGFSNVQPKPFCDPRSLIDQLFRETFSFANVQNLATYVAAWSQNSLFFKETVSYYSHFLVPILALPCGVNVFAFMQRP